MRGLNERQERAIVLAAIAGILMLMFPPLVIEAQGHRISAGYGFLLSVKRPRSVDVGLLFAQWVGLALFAALAVHFLRGAGRGAFQEAELEVEGGNSRSESESSNRPVENTTRERIFRALRRTNLPALIIGSIVSTPVLRQLMSAPAQPDYWPVFVFAVCTVFFLLTYCIIFAFMMLRELFASFGGAHHTRPPSSELDNSVGGERRADADKSDWPK